MSSKSTRAGKSPRVSKPPAATSPSKPTRGPATKPVTHLVESSVLSAMSYHPARQELTLTFRDHHGTYRYTAVPPELWSALLAAPSKGTFLNQILKPLNLSFRRLGRPTPPL